MKLDRRSFIAFGVGASAGVAVTPIPWKLMDDLSIWTQNWAWTPVPPDGEASYETSVCTLCPGGCGITVRKIDDRVVKIEGADGNPINDGGICVLGLSGPQLLYGPTRITSPMKKIKGELKPISWDQALSELAKKLGNMREDGKAGSLACISGSDQGTVPEIFARFLKAFGSQNFICEQSSADTYKITNQKMQGAYAAPEFDFANADYVLSFGSGLLDGWGSPVRMFQANSSWQNNNTTVVQVEPRLSNTAAKADQWIPIKPGSEADLALGMAHVIIKKSLYNNAAISRTTDFNAFKSLVLGKSLDEVQNVTGIEKKVIEKLAKDFINPKKRSVAVAGKGQGTTPGSIREIMAVQALNALAGSINRKGGVFTSRSADYINWPAIVMDRIATDGIRKKRIDEAGTGKFLGSRHLLNRLPKVINAAKGSPVEVMFIYGANPCYSMAGSKAVNKAIEKIPFVVSFSSYLDETAKKADLVLPNHTNLERYEDVYATSGINKAVIGLSRPVVQPLLNTMHSGDVIIKLANKIGGSVAKAFPWKSYKACLKQTLGNSWNPLMKNGFKTVVSSPVHSGRFNFAPLVKYSNSVVKAEGKGGENVTLILKDSIRLTNGYIGSTPYMMKTVSDKVLKTDKKKKMFYSRIEINPDTAKGLKLADGRYATITTSKGSAKVMVTCDEGIMPGVAALSRGLGHTAYDGYLKDKGVNVNNLIGPVEDPVTGLDAAWGIMAKLTRA